MSRTDEFTVEFGDNESDSLSGARGVGNDVSGARSSAAKVAFTMRSVKNHLVARVSVNRAHDTRNDGSVFIKRVRHRSKTVGRAGSSRNDLIFRSQSVFVYAVNDSFKVVARRSRNNDFLRACLNMSHRLFFRAVEARAFKNYVYVKFTPGKILSLGHSVYGDFFTVDGDRTGNFNGLSVFFENGFFVRNGVKVFAYSAAISALSGVVLQKVCQHFGAGKIVYSDYFVAFSAEHLSERKTTDTAETVNRNSNICHFYILRY